MSDESNLHLGMTVPIRLTSWWRPCTDKYVRWSNLKFKFNYRKSLNRSRIWIKACLKLMVGASCNFVNRCRSWIDAQPLPSFQGQGLGWGYNGHRNSMSVELVGVLTVECELLSNIWHPSVLVNVMTPDHTAVLVSHRHLQSHWVWQ